MSATLVWFRRDLRLNDNPALAAAVERGAPLVPVYIWAPEEESPWEPGAASRWWLHHSLTALAEELQSRGSQLIVRRGPSDAVLRSLADECQADAVFWNRLYDPPTLERDASIKTELREAGREVESFNASLLIEPWDIATKQGNPYQVFTPFWKAAAASLELPAAWAPPEQIAGPDGWPESVPIKELQLLPKRNWDAGFSDRWSPGTRGAAEQLERFLDSAVDDYGEDRNRPDLAGSSRLSPHLHFGEISPWSVYAAVQERVSGKKPAARKSAETYLAELGWREFAHHLLYHFPHTTDQPLRTYFEDFPWEDDETHLEAWQRGQTGYPLVDAGMRELWTTGWMHNRVRMVVASFLTKNLRSDWRTGAEWFWDTLVDADLANNTLGWQWTAGCGADAAPYFRIFNPSSQASRYDPQGDYIRRWVPELAELPDKHLYEPWNTPADVLEAAGVRLGETYPEPIVDHAETRKEALAIYNAIKPKK